MDEQDLEIIWDALLSREAERVRTSYSSLSSQEQQGVLAHLRRMATEEGWHPEQRKSALTALEAIEEMNP